MNKKELIKHFEDMPYVSVSQMGKKSFIDLIEQLDEPQKVQVPQFVADWIEECKKSGNLSIFGAIEYSDQKMSDWFFNWDNQELFARAWLDGYEVEKEKRFLVTMKGKIEENVLTYGNNIFRYFFTRESTSEAVRIYHTRKELEESGFGWVFDCEGIEIEEVAE